MEFEGNFTVPGRPDDVILRFTDIERMARCMPGASLEGRDKDGNYIGVMTVAFGPKRLKFKGRMNCSFDISKRSGVISGRGAADGRAARISFETRFTVSDAHESQTEAPLSFVTISSKAELGGVIADFARTGGLALANVLIKEFEGNLAQELRIAEADRPTGEAKPLSATKVIWGALKSKLT